MTLLPVKRLLPLLLSCALLAGCLPPPASVLIKKDTEAQRRAVGTLSANGDSYVPAVFYTPDSLNMRLRRKNVDYIEAVMRDGTRRDVPQAQLKAGELIYGLDDERRSIPLQQVRRLVVRKQYTAERALESTGYGAFLGVGGALLPAVNRDSFAEAGKSAGIGALIGVPLFNGIGYLTRDKERIFIGGYESAENRPR